MPLLFSHGDMVGVRITLRAIGRAVINIRLLGIVGAVLFAAVLLVAVNPSGAEDARGEGVRQGLGELLARRGEWVSTLAVLGVICLLLVGLLLWNRSLKALVAERTRELSKELAERKRAEEELTNANERLQVLFTCAPDAYFLLDPAGNFVDGNEAAQQISGYSNEEKNGTNILEWGAIPDAQLPRVREILAGSAQGYPSGPDEFTFMCKDGTSADLEVRTFTTRIAGRMFILGIARDISKRKRAEKALVDSEQRLRVLSSKLLTAQEEERRRVARDLHDSIGQYLAAVKFSIEGVIGTKDGREDSAAIKRLESLVTMVQGAIEEVRRIYTGLRPSVLDDLGIVVTIDWFSRELRKTYPDIRIFQYVDAKEDKIKKSLKIVIFRVIQEALNNIARHSKAKFAALSLVERDGALELTVEDDGTGFDVDEALKVDSDDRGLGLMGMKERVELSGGVFDIRSSIGKGTKVNALWPAPDRERS